MPKPHPVASLYSTLLATLVMQVVGNIDVDVHWGSTHVRLAWVRPFRDDDCQNVLPDPTWHQQPQRDCRPDWEMPTYKER